jgi:hypothetical protein
METARMAFAVNVVDQDLGILNVFLVPIHPHLQESNCAQRSRPACLRAFCICSPYGSYAFLFQILDNSIIQNILFFYNPFQKKPPEIGIFPYIFLILNPSENKMKEGRVNENQSGGAFFSLRF